MIKMFRAGTGNLKIEKDRIVAAGWQILSTRQSTIYGKFVEGKWVGDWLIKAFPKDIFKMLSHEKQEQIVKGELCSPSTELLKCYEIDSLI